MTVETIHEAGAKRANPYEDRTSLEFNFRRRRFAIVERLIRKALDEKGRARILDLGGTEYYWLIGEDFIRRNAHRLEILMVNNEAQPDPVSPIFRNVLGSATDPALLEGERFDLVHSNSVIEHVGDYADMQAFADNVRRLGERYYVQTPNYWFPFEPHFRVVGFQYLPKSLRIRLLQTVRMGFFRPVKEFGEAKALIEHHRLVSTRRMRKFFPDAEIAHEKVWGLNKSIIALRDR